MVRPVIIPYKMWKKLTSITWLGVPSFLKATTYPFRKIGDDYYHIESNSPKNWYAAYESCRQMGSSLIAFESSAEWSLITNYLNNTNIYAKYWTSGSSLANGKGHVWFSSGQPVVLDIWLPGEPNNAKGQEFCDDMGRNLKISKNWGLNDRICAVEIPYICKTQRPKTAVFVVW